MSLSSGCKFLSNSSCCLAIILCPCAIRLWMASWNGDSATVVGAGGGGGVAAISGDGGGCSMQPGYSRWYNNHGDAAAGDAASAVAIRDLLCPSSVER